MTSFSAVLKLQIKNRYRGWRARLADNRMSTRGGRAKSGISSVAMLLSFAMLLAMYGYAGYVVTVIGLATGIVVEIFALMLTVSQVLVFIMGIRTVILNTFSAGDREFLEQLPLKKGVVFASKLAMAYFSEFIICALMLIPMLIGFIAAHFSAGVSLPFSFYFGIPFFLVVAPIVPLFMVTLAAFPVIKIQSYFKNKSIATLLFSILGIVGYYLLYMSLMPKMDGIIQGNAEALSQKTADILVNFAKAFYYNFALSRAAFGVNILVNAAIIAASVGVGGLLIYFTANALYFKTAAKYDETDNIRKKTKKQLAGRVNRQRMLVLREFKLLLRDSKFAVNSVIGIVIVPFMIALMSNGEAMTLTDENGQIVSLSIFSQQLSTVGMSLFYIILLSGTNYVASLAFSREGKRFYMLRYLPVEVKDIFKAKRFLAYTISLIGTAAATVSAAVFAKTGLINSLLLAAFSVVFGLAFTEILIFRDLKKPNINWVNPVEVINRNFYAAIPVFIGMAFGFVSLFLSMSVSQNQSLNDLTKGLIYWGVMAAICVGMLIFSKVTVRKNQLEKYFNKINTEGQG